jgi:hypothetical protein
MSTSAKSPNTLRHGGPGASHENARQPPDLKKGKPDAMRNRSEVSGGGGERDSHHTHDPNKKGGQRKE